MADSWNTFCSDVMGLKTTPRELDDELHDAVANLECQLRSPEPSYEDETINDSFESIDDSQNASNSEPLPVFVPEHNDSELDEEAEEEDFERPRERYTVMIRDALLTAKNPLTVSQIYKYVMKRYPYFRGNNLHYWKNSIRHNLTSYTGKFFKRMSPSRVANKSGRFPVFWSLGYKWRDIDIANTNNTAQETRRERPRKGEDLKKRKGNAKLVKEERVVQKSCVSMEMPHPCDEDDGPTALGNNLHSDAMELDCSKEITSELKSKKKCSKTKRTKNSEVHEEFNERISCHHGFKKRERDELTDDLSIKKCEATTPNQTTQHKPLKHLPNISTAPSTTTNLTEQNSSNNDVPSSPVSLSPASANRDFVFFECQGVSCLGIPTPPSSVCSNTSSVASEETSPGPDETAAEDAGSRRGFPLLEAVLKEIEHDLPAGSLCRQGIEEDDSYMLDISGSSAQHDLIKHEASTSTLQQHASELEISTTPSPTSPLDLTTPTQSSVQPATSQCQPLPKPSKENHQCKTSNSDEEKELSEAKSVSMGKLLNPASGLPLKQMSKNKKANKFLKKKKPTALKKSSRSKVTKQSPPPLALIKKPPRKLIRNNAGMPMYFLIPTMPQFVSSGTTRFVAPTAARQQSCMMVPAKTTAALVRPDVEIIRQIPAPYHQPQATPTLRTVSMPKLAPIRPPIRSYRRICTWNFPVTQYLPEVTVRDICQTLQHDEWEVNLELHPMFKATLLQGFEYESHCLRPFVSDCRFTLWDPGLLQQPEISANYLPEMSGMIRNCLPSDAICPPLFWRSVQKTSAVSSEGHS